MNPKLICLLVVVASVCADVKVPEPERFPPGVDPALCPGYPNCDNALLHGTEKITAVQTNYRSVVPSVSYVDPWPYYGSYRSLYYPPIASVRTIAPVGSVAAVPPVVSAVYGPSDILKVAPLSTDTPLDPNKPVVPFASSLGLSSRYIVWN